MFKKKENPLFEGKNITLGICACGSIGETLELAQTLNDEGAALEIILTPNAAQLMPVIMLQKYSNKPILIEEFELPKCFDPNHGKNKTDAFLVAPASANTIGKAAHGIGDNLLSTRLLAASCPVIFVPRCNPHMYKNPRVQNNMSILKGDGVRFVENTEKIGMFPAIQDVIDVLKEILL